MGISIVGTCGVFSVGKYFLETIKVAPEEQP